MYKEPIPGWTDNVYGPSGVCLWALKGFIHVIWGNENNPANMVPVDYCINALVCSARDVYQRHVSAQFIRQNYDVPIYNYLYPNNNLTWGNYMEYVKFGLHKPLERALW